MLGNWFGGEEAQARKSEYHAMLAAGDTNAAFKLASAQCTLHPQDPVALSNAAACAIGLGLWQEARGFAERCLALSAKDIPALDSLAHAAFLLGESVLSQSAGQSALAARDALIPKAPPIPHRPMRSIGRKKLIAFSLFGALPKYCEGAVLNAQAQRDHFPDWICRFYIDERVPEHVVARLKALGAEVVLPHAKYKSLPPTLWRFAAWDDPQVDAVLFRDADSILSAREAKLCSEWLAEGSAFHCIRDFGSHTELLLAGLWGLRGKPLPKLLDLARLFFVTYKGSAHFADQYFLRYCVWPYARGRILFHDSVFQFGKNVIVLTPPEDMAAHIGANAAHSSLDIAFEDASARAIEWSLLDREGQIICTYLSALSNGHSAVALPQPYIEAFRAGAMTMKVKAAL